MSRNFNRDLLVLLKSEFMSEHAIEQEVECLHVILAVTETFESFTICHELVSRNRISSKPRKLREVFQITELRPFYFLLNKN